MNRIFRHLLLASGSISAILIAYFAGASGGGLDRASIVSAYVCLGLYCWALLIGPLHLLQRRPPQLNIYLRRDVGIWAALTGLFHLAIGTEVSMDAAYIGAFVSGSEGLATEAIRQRLFSWGSLAGFAAGIIFLLLLALSSNLSLRLLGPKWWKRLQRSSYLAFVLFVLHGFAFQVLEIRSWVLVAALTLAVVLVGIVQFRGARIARSVP